MTVSIRRMTLGSGFKYLMSSIAQSDGAAEHASALTRYYAESGTPPGRFMGAGLAGLAGGEGVAVGVRVSEEHLFRMLGMLQDPLTGEKLGRAPRRPAAAYAERVSRRISSETGGLSGEDREEAVLNIKAEERVAEARISRAVAGFDLTFSAPKSVSVAWGLADAGTQAVIYQAHQDALAYVLRYAERHVFTSRSGTNGVIQEDIRGVVAAAFDHWDSRAGDPQLHTHLVVMNRVQGEDGRWRTLDSRGMFKATVALSEMYNGVLSDYLTRALGVGWEPERRRHSAAPKYEIQGVSQDLREAFSRRSAAIEEATNKLIPAFIDAHGRSPNSREMLRLRQQATLETRPDKRVRPLAEQVGEWRARAADVLGSDPVPWVATLKDRNDLPLLRADDLTDAMLHEVGAITIDAVAEKRATFSRSNILAEVLRQLHGVRFASPDDRMRVAERTTGLALGRALRISAPEVAHTPERFRRPDGTSRFRARGFETYTTQALLDAEARLLEAGRSLSGPKTGVGVVADIAAAPVPGSGRILSADQALAVEQVATSGRRLDVLVGPAGTGKSTTMGGLRAAWERQFGAGSVVGLAPSAAAAQVLAEELGIPTENTSKWLAEQPRQSERLSEIESLRAQINRAGPSMRTSRMRKRLDALVTEVDRWSFKAGQLVIVDEASLAGTFSLDALTERANRAGAKVVLVGDWAQLSSVEAGGAFHMLFRDRDLAPELSDVRRFAHGWEKKASVGLRIGDPDAVDVYEQHGRVTGGDRESMLDLLYQAWRADTEAGMRSLMIANDNDTVRELNQRARADRVAAGEVAEDGVITTEGVVVGVGDLVVTRQNNRQLVTGRGWVKNGDEWVVTAVGTDGAVTVQRRTGRRGLPAGRVVLPRDYVAEHLELGYATTVHRAQGRTADTAHAFVNATTHREGLYVAATRGREANRLYIDTMYDPDADTAHGPPPMLPARDVLRQVLANRGVEMSATEALNADWREQHGIAQVLAEYNTLAAVALRERYDDLIGHRSGLSEEEVARVQYSASYGALLAALRQAETHGVDVDARFPSLVASRPLDDAEDVAAVLHERVELWMSTAVEPGPERGRIGGLFPKAPAATDPDVSRALEEREALIERAAREEAREALHQSKPWIKRLGSPPTDPNRRERWTNCAETVAAYRERWGITGRHALGVWESMSLEQESQRRLAQRAVDQALQIHRQDQQSVGAAVHIGDKGLSREGIEW
jgi:conjugative relaxase-like TrwC/TraI family protein